MMLLDAIDAAVHHGERAERFAPHLATMRDLGGTAWERLTSEQTRRVQTAGREMLEGEFSTSKDALLFHELTRKNPSEDVATFAAFLFRRRCPRFVNRLLTDEAWNALGACVASWSRPRKAGRPRKGDTRLPRWDAAEELMTAADLVSPSSDTLEADHRKWRAMKKG
jgi:hypothetical protein